MARTLHYAASALLEGTFVFWCAIAFERRLLALAWVSLVAAIVTGVAWLMGTASDMSGTPLGAVLPQGIAGIVLTQTRFGIDWQVRGALTVVLAACLFAQSSKAQVLARWIGLIASSAFVLSLAWAGHGAAADDLPFDFLHLPADLLHLLATGAWLGALVPLGVLLAQAQRGSAEDLAVAHRATSRFSTLGVVCVGILIVTGTVNTWFLSGSVPALVGTLYGQLLLLKIALFAVMIAIANVNRTRLIPLLERQDGKTARKLCRNALTEASAGIFVLGIVGIIGTLPPGLHTEPRWPFPYTLDLSEIEVGAQKLLDVASTLLLVCLAAGALAANRRRYWGVLVSVAFALVFAGIAAVTARPGIVRAYPTTYFASTEPYAAPSVARGAPLYAANCTACHGVDGRGDGPIAKSLPIAPADLTEEHIFAHNVGDLYWWISHGRANGVMPGFENALTPQQRWDVINFVLARAAGVQTAQVGDQISASAAPPLPDFAFERHGAQNTLSETFAGGPVLLVLFGESAPKSRLKELANLPLRMVAVDLEKRGESPQLTAKVSDDVRATLELFRLPNDGGETELMLDRNGSVRARWTAGGKEGLAGGDTLLADAASVAKIPAAAANHAGHGG